MMKKLLLFALCAISTLAFSQGNRPTSGQTISIDNFSPHSPSDIQSLDHVTHDTYSGNDLRTMPDDQYGMIFPPIQLYDMIMYWKWDTLTMDWILYSRSIDFMYDSAHNLTQYTGQAWNGTDWLNSGKRSLSYDERNNQTLDLHQGWNGNEWVNTEQVISAYDIYDSLEVSTRQQWKVTSWENFTQYQYTYDSNRNLVNEIYKSWYIDQWVVVNQELYVYDDSLNLTQQTSQHWNGSFWENKDLVVNTYDTNNNLTTSIGQKWKAGVWDNVWQRTYEYDSSNNLISLYGQSWSNLAWKDTDRVMYAYDANDNLRDVLYQKWINAAWENFRQQLLTHGANHNLISHLVWLWSANEWVISSERMNTYDVDFYQTHEVFRRFNTDGTYVTNGDSTQYLFTILIDTDESANKEDKILVYPNPSQGKFTISNAVADKVEVFDISGKRVYAAALHKEQSSLEIDLTRHGVGIYFVVLHQGRKMYSRKIEVQ